MSHLTVEAVKRSCAFVLVIEFPLKTMERVVHLFSDRDVQVDMMYLNMRMRTEAELIIHCGVEKDRLQYFIRLLERMEGVLELEWLEAKGRNRQYSND